MDLRRCFLTLPSPPPVCPPVPPPVYSRYNFGRIRIHTVRYVPMTVPTVSSLSQSRSKSQSKSQDDPGHQGPGCPHRLTPTFTYCVFTDQAVLALFSTGPVVPSFSTPISPLSIPHTCPLLLDLNDHRPVRLFFFFIAPLPVTEPRFRDDRLLFIFSPLPLFGHVRPAFVLALALVVSVSHNDAPSGPPPSDQPVSCISGSSDLTCPTAVSGFGPPVPR